MSATASCWGAADRSLIRMSQLRPPTASLLQVTPSIRHHPCTALRVMLSGPAERQADCNRQGYQSQRSSTFWPTCTPGHAKLCLVMSIVGCWVKDSWLAVYPCNVAAPQITVQHTRLDAAGNVYKEHLQIVQQCVPKLSQPPVTCRKTAITRGSGPMPCSERNPSATCQSQRCCTTGFQDAGVLSFRQLSKATAKRQSQQQLVC